MSSRRPRVFNIAPGGNFLDILAKQLLNGFPLDGERPVPPLSSWTVLLPTRRAARQLGLILLRESGQRALLLPRIRPIGDLDDDQPSHENDSIELPQAISRSGQFFILLSLLHQWSKENPLIGLAQEIANSPSQSLALATSLLKLVDQFEIEELTLENIGVVYEADLSEHRDAILSLLSLIKIELPKKLHDENLLGQSDRRNRLIRLEAKNIADAQVGGPIVAAGSTGTIPATRELLRVIASHPQGAIVLPGLDQSMDDEAWKAVKPDHPQYSIRKLLDELHIKRDEIPLLSMGNEPRNVLSSELMRPTETADQWRSALMVKQNTITAALQNLHLIEAPDRHMEARSIALILRGALEKPHQTAALITPDRDLARRVKVELLRWNIAIDDSAGEPLTKFGLPLLARLIFEATSNGFTPATLVSLLNHPDCDLGLPPAEMLRRLDLLEIVVLRNDGVNSGLENLQKAFERARLAFNNSERVHPLVARLSDEEWQGLQNLVIRIVANFEPLTLKDELPFSDQLKRFTRCSQSCATLVDQATKENQAFYGVMSELEAESHRLPPCNFITACAIILNSLQNETFFPPSKSHPRLAIYGLLEARMTPADILILGALNETKWPAQPDPGPWLNRPMREILGLQQPEREIGVSAHDFAQGLGYSKVYLTWSKRVDGAPLISSRWILRLQAVLQAAGLNPGQGKDENWLKLAKAIDEPSALQPMAKPRPAPPLDARPIRISVTEVEKLIRDPYAVYARRVLKLEPLPLLAKTADVALRGTLFHLAINEWNRQQPSNLLSNSLETLLHAGSVAFAPFMDDPEIASFWWPRFQNMANWLSSNEVNYRSGVVRVQTEIAGQLDFEIDGLQHTLYGRADRIDLMSSGQARIIDYKTGSPPTAKQVTIGISPQLPLEAAILAYGKFESLEPVGTEAMDYIHISGGTDPGEVKGIIPTDGSSIMDIANRHLAGLKILLASYRKSQQVYLPRVAPLKEEGEMDYDHLSRFREWMLGGGAV